MLLYVMRDAELLFVESPVFYRRGNKVLNAIYLSVQEGEIVGLLGRNGSGKSTLLNIIFGSLRAPDAYLRFKGTRFKQGYRTAVIGLLPQCGYLPLDFRLKKLVSFFDMDVPRFFRIPFIRSANTYLGEFSVGERRLLETMLLLCSTKPVLLLDEPFAGLSPVQVEWLREQLLITKRNKGILLTDHRYQDVMEVSDRTILLKHGNAIPIRSRDDLVFHQYCKL
ncbi:ATP-binding cassette domain-containing protein [Sphingobacterium suaedae]|uniref:ATP-binding cassette domain-containing protein n=1 Tax=Sphingobacterium suaedae TaxID=1686402 RepID=A0ABW5KJ24_9SPHI